MTEESDFEREIPGPGDIVQYARDQRGLSLLELAEELRISEAKLQSLEANDFTEVGTDTFVRGYFRASARILKLDADDLMSEYDAYLLAADLIDKTSSSGESKKILAPNIMKWLIIGVALLVLAVVGALLLPASSSSEALEPKPADDPSMSVVEVKGPQAAVLTASETLAAEDNTQNEDQATPATGVSASQSEVESQNPELPARNAAELVSRGSDGETVIKDNSTEVLLTETGAVASELGSELSSAIASSIAAGETGVLPEGDATELSFEFESECWLEVYEADGNRLFSGVKQAADFLVVSGVGPFQVQLGNAAVVNLKVDGQNFAIEKRSGAKTLKFTVPASTAR